jgi:hypothetical protein
MPWLIATLAARRDRGAHCSQDETQHQQASSDAEGRSTLGMLPACNLGHMQNLLI